MIVAIASVCVVFKIGCIIELLRRSDSSLIVDCKPRVIVHKKWPQVKVGFNSM